MADFFLQNDIKLGINAFYSLLREFNLLVKRRKLKPKSQTTVPWIRKHPYLIKDFIPTAINQLWVSDLTYLKVKNLFYSVFIVTDAFSRKIVGYHFDKDYKAENCISALKMALSGNKNIEGLIHHSDRGSQYTSMAHIKILEEFKIKISMTNGGNPYENAIAERINGIVIPTASHSLHKFYGREWGK